MHVLLTPRHISRFIFKMVSFLVCLFLVNAGADAQRQFDQSKEVGFAFGTSYYMGDLNEGKHLNGRFTPGFGAFYRHNFSQRISLRVSYLKGRVEAWDADSSDPWRQNRNLHFRNDISELSTWVEINYLDHRLGDPGDRFTAFLFLGLAAFNHMPEASIDGKWVPLQPLGTEGQGTSWGNAYGVEPYSTSGVSVPIGFGFKSNIGAFTAITFDWGVRKTWSDYLDDVSGLYADRAVLLQERGEMTVALSDPSLAPEASSINQGGLQRGDSSRDDFYGFISASISFRISKKPTTCWSEI
jgi:hypothetical protein